MGLACHVGVGLQWVGGTLGLMWGEPAWWWNDMVEVAMESGLGHGGEGWGLCAMLGWQYGGTCAWQAGMVKESQLQGLRLRCGMVRLVHHVGEASQWVGSGRALCVVLG